MKQRDSFPHEGYSYFEDELCYIVAGRYYVHRLDKQTMEWSDIREDMNALSKLRKKETKEKMKSEGGN